MFDFHPIPVLKHELRAMMPGTSECAARLRAVLVNLDADQARLARARGETGVSLGSKRDDDAVQRRGGTARRSSA